MSRDQIVTELPKKKPGKNISGKKILEQVFKGDLDELMPPETMSVFSCKTVNNTVVRLENTKKGFSENDLDFIQKHMGKGTSSNASLGGVQDTLGEYIKYTMYKLTTSNNVEKKKKRKKK